MNNKLEKDYEVMFTKMYRDFSNSYENYVSTGKNMKSQFNDLYYNFISDVIDNYKHHLFKLLGYIENKYGYKESQRILKYNTREYHFNEIANILEITKEELLNIFEFGESEVQFWFDYDEASIHDQRKIYDLYKFLIILQEINNKDKKLKLLDILKYSYIDTSDYVFDENDKDKIAILPYVLSNWRDKSDYEIAYDVIRNYDNKKEFKGDIKLLKQLKGE